MSPHKRDAKHHAKARRRRYRTAHERLARDRRQAQHAATAVEQAFHDLGLPEDLVVEIEGRLRSQPPNCAAYEAGIKICPRVCSVRCPSAPGSSD